MTVTINLLLSPAAVVTGVGACIVDALDQTPAGAPDRQCLLLPTQSIPWDNCDCGGQVALAIQSVFGSTRFPTPETGKDWEPCGPPWSVTQAVVSVTRCLPSMDEQGNPPTCDEYLTAAIILENDRTAVRQALACCLTEMKQAQVVGAWSLGSSVTVGESGSCAGSETTFMFAQRSCLCGTT